MDKKAEMFALVEQWRKSGLTRAKFAQNKGIDENSFYYWCRKQYQETYKRTKEATFIELKENTTALQPQQKQALIELELPSGLKMKIYS
jgi:transposase-like protein